MAQAEVSDSGIQQQVHTFHIISFSGEKNIHIYIWQLPTQGMLNFVIIAVLSLHPVAHAHYLAVHFSIAMDLFSRHMMLTKAATFHTFLISPLVPLPFMDEPSFTLYSLTEAYEQCTTCLLSLYFPRNSVLMPEQLPHFFLFMNLKKSISILLIQSVSQTHANLSI